MKKTSISLALALLILGSCAEGKPPEEPKAENARARQGPIETIDSSTGHKDKTFASEWSVTKTVLKGGKQEGVELLTLDNGKLEITVIPTRGMGILDIRMGDVRLGWDSPVKEVVHPSHIGLESRGGLGWLEGFNEWIEPLEIEVLSRDKQFSK